MMFIFKSVFYAIVLFSFFFVAPVEANNNLKLEVNWHQKNNLQFPLQIIVEYHDVKQKAEETALKKNIQINRQNKQLFQLQLAASYSKLKNNVMSDRHIYQQNIHKEYSNLPMNALILNDNNQLLELLNDTRVKAVYPDIMLYANVLQSKLLIGADKADLNLAANGSGSSVVVLDTGVNYTHAVFGNCTAPGVPAATCRVIVSSDFASDDGQNDDNGHGSNVSGIVASIASGAKLIVFDVFNGAGAFSSDVIAGINWAIANQVTYNIASINMSLGGTTKYTSPCNSNNPFSNPYKTPIANAKNAGILSVIASGNDAYTDGVTMPACIPDAVSVGAVYDSNIGSITWSTTPICTDSTTAADKVTCFSNSASFLKLMAPGALITAAGLSQGGTSQATPHVAALAAILHSVYPSESASEIENRMVTSGSTITDPRNGLTFPRIDAWKAVGAINDTFDQAISLNPASPEKIVNTENASKQVGEPNHVGIIGGKSVWFSFSSSVAGTLELDTLGSNFDTILAVYSGTTVDNLSLLIDNNDSPAADGSSLVSLTITENTLYSIAVDDVTNIGGELLLKVDFTESEPVPMLSSWGEGLMLFLLLVILLAYGSQRKAAQSS